MEQMYQDYKDIADFYIVYISEAHAEDDRRPVPYAAELGIKEHTNYGERCGVAKRLTKDKKLTIPCLIDGMDNLVADAYKGFPDRVFLVRKDGKLGIAAKRGPWGFRPGLTAARSWLSDYGESGKEPDIDKYKPEETPDAGQLQQDLLAAYQGGDYAKALSLAEKINKLTPGSYDTLYNIACMHCLLDHKEEAYTWLGKAIDAGYNDTDHLLADNDFKDIRETERFAKLVERAKNRKDTHAAPPIDPETVKPVLGDWEMKTMLQDQQVPATMSISLSEGKLVGVWKSQGREMEMKDLKFDGKALSFSRSMGAEMKLEFSGEVKGSKIEGKYSSPFGELESNGTREAETE